MTELKEYFQQRYQGRQSFLDNVIFPIFGEEHFDDAYDLDVLELYPELENVASATGVASVLNVGTIDVDFNPISIFDITVSSHTLLTRNRVGIQQIIRRIMSTYSSAFMIFHYQDNECWDWRFTFCSKEKNNEVTDNKRYTFMLGPNQSCRTVADNFSKLMQKGGVIELKDIKEAFDVEALSDEFFAKYKQHYERFVEYVTGKRFVKKGQKWEEIKTGEPHPQMYADFGANDKLVRDYVKKLLGRIVFLHFLQKKGWMGVPEGKQWGDGDPQFMLHLYEQASPEQQADFLDSVLEPLFSDGLDTERSAEDDLFDTHVNMKYGRRVKVPYLNGGLFERDALDEITTQFPAEFFHDLLDFLYQYNFTIDENDPDDAQVGVDPEMLGRIFENLLEDNKDKGAYYTPKEIVRYMCRQSLIAYLNTDIHDNEAQNAIEQFVNTYDVSLLGGADSLLANKIDERLKSVKICDPAIGSGAFPMGLLKELFLCRGVIENFDNAAEIKRHIIQQNIYGVDVERGAVDIARLRFWLSLVVDEETPHTLPNLDFKIMHGNSLLEQYNGVDLSRVANDNKIVDGGFELSLFDRITDVLRKQLRDMITQYYNVDNHSEKHDLLCHIRENIIQQMRENGISVDMENIDIQSNDQFFLWHTWFNDVFNRPSGCNGFDIVIGNPPYISAPAQIANQQLAEQRERIKSCQRYETLLQKWDLYVPFMEMGLKMLCDNGVFAMIVPFPLSNQLYGKNFREWAAWHYNIFEIADLNGTKVFDNATVSNLIFFAKNNGATSETKISHINERMELTSDFVQPIASLVQDQAKYVWNFSRQQRSTDIHSEMNVLGDYCYVSKGMVLNADETKAKGEFKKEDLISDVKDEIHCREYIEAKDIEKYRVKRTRFLEYNTPRCPEKLSRATFRELYEVDKLVINRLGDIQAVLDNCVHYLLSDSTFMGILWKDLRNIDNKSISASIKRYSTLPRQEMERLSEDVRLEYLLAILNSKYATTLLANLRGGDYHIYPEHVRNIPIPRATSEQQEEISQLVKTIIGLKRNEQDPSGLQSQLDDIIFNLYNAK